jgi:pimeloyl-ACP methyl ester carboxylesterase
MRFDLSFLRRGMKSGRPSVAKPVMLAALALAALPLAGCASTSTSLPAAPRLFTQAYGVKPGAAETLYVVVHGDGTRTAIDTTPFVQALAAAEPDAAIIRLLRPGFSDGLGNSSPGTRGTNGDDEYTSERINTVADTIAALRVRYRRARIVAIGEAGGAVFVANLAGLRPGVIDGMVLVSCPCALPEWRRYMARRDPANPRWREAKVISLDPLQTAGGIPSTLRAALLVGGKDDVVPARFARAYAEALSLRGIATDFRILPDRQPPVLDDPQVIEAARRLAAALPRRTR